MNSAQRIFEILDAVPEVAERPDPVRLRPMRGEIELQRRDLRIRAQQAGAQERELSRQARRDDRPRRPLGRGQDRPSPT